MAIGIDVGSRFIKVCVLNGGEDPFLPPPKAHGGKPVEALREIWSEFSPTAHGPVGLTGSAVDGLADLSGLSMTDLTRSTIRGVRKRVPEVRNILDIGASSVSLLELTESGALKDVSRNTMCAAGTGSFLDAQAQRMGVALEESQHFSSIEDPPSIATRCTVFAKSDLIHRQQEGYGKEALWSGLCRGLSATLLQTLLRGKPLQGPTVVTGGVARNSEVVKWLRTLSASDIRTYPGAEFAAAYGAAILAEENGNGKKSSTLVPSTSPDAIRQGPHRPVLELVKSRYPSFQVEGQWEDAAGNEVRITRWPEAAEIAGYLGVDVGSTSTKAVLVAEDGSVLVDIYRKTAGDPIGATQALFQCFQDIQGKRDAQIQVLGCGTTGSGRKLVGSVIGADAVVNEITTHLAGASATDPRAETIFEIGGQDSKFIRAECGVMLDTNMNYVCAAGTGSFVEEQALKLGYRVDQVGDLVMGIAPPHTSDRCTVFMEQDVERLIRQGHTPPEALAAVMYSVVENYLAKVVGHRSFARDTVFFCGATARNRGLVAAFEKLLGTRVVVSPYCHVMGAFGVALLTRDTVKNTGGASRFRGLDLSTRKVSLTQETCDLCQNACRITYAHIQGESEVPSWGYLCGRDPEAEEKRNRSEFEAFHGRRRLEAKAFATHRQAKKASYRHVVGVPQTLTNLSHGALWQTLLDGLGCRVLFSRGTDDRTREAAANLVGSEYCFPAKLAHGHVADLLDRQAAKWIFLPHFVSEEVPPEHTRAFLCPVVCAMPGMVRSALRVAGRKGDERILSPLVDLRWDEKRQVKELAKALATPLGVSPRRIRAAWRAALAAQRSYETLCQEEGARVLAEARSEGRPVILALGRSYNLHDSGANLDLPLKVAEKGYPILPAEMAPIANLTLGPELKNIYWVNGQRLLRALLWAREEPDVYPIWFTNFKCGPDSFLLTYAERIMGEKPFLILELDEHGADAGYMTRIEAFLDVVEARKGPFPLPQVIPNRTHPPEAFRDRVLWVPPLHPVAAPMAAAALRGEGLDARSLPLEDEASMALGRQVTRGGECIPMTLTIGRLLQTLRARGGNGSREAFFMPAAHGPCRFGQYNLLERLILEKEGFGELAIMSPDNDNAYQGLGEKVRRQIWKGSLVGDLLFKLKCRYRPYEARAGQTEELLVEAQEIMEEAFEKQAPLKPAFRRAVAPFRKLPRPPSTKPLVGVVGEIFVRCNFYSNQYVVDAIESYGGEAWLAPFHEWVLYACWAHENRAREGWDVMGQAKSYLKNRYLFESEHAWYHEVDDLLGDRKEPSVQESVDAARPYATYNYGGETLITIGRTIKFFEEGAAMVVNCSPFGCMQGQAISGILNEVRMDQGKPVVNLFYDGTGSLNDVIGVFLRNLPETMGRGSPGRAPIAPV